MRVLVVLAQPPLPEGGAAGRCAVGLLQGLRAHGLEVTALAADQARVHDDPPPEPPGVEVLEVPLVPGWAARRLRVTDPRGYLGRGAFGARVRELAARADVVHLDELDGAAAARVVDRPALVHLHYALRRDRDLPRRFWTGEGREFLELRAAERRARRRARWLLTNSQEVAADLRREARSAEVAVAPLALDPAAYGAPASLDAPVAGLIGTAAWRPTATAVRRLLADVWPRVRARLPEARLLLAGRGMEPATFPDLPRAAGVEWLGAVPSAEGFLRGLGVLLYPLERGSGTKVKVLEALALGLPVVTTPPGAEGLGSRAGVVVDVDAERQAEATAALLDDPANRRATGRAARATFLAHHTPEPATRPIVEVYRRMVG